jgi:HEAT repeat protein
MIESTQQAMAVVTDAHRTEAERERAIHYLEANPSPEATEALISALETDDYGVRWAAGKALAHMGEPALPPLLHALINRSDSPRLRKGAYQVLHENTSPWIQDHSQELLTVLRGRWSEIDTMRAAQQLLATLESAQSAS